jgi:hypothetical protein
MGAPRLGGGFRSQAATCPYRTSPAMLSEMVALVGVSAPASELMSESAILPAFALGAFGKNIDAASERGPPLG